MIFRDLLRMVGLLLRLSRKQAGPSGPVQRNLPGPHGICYDLYQPRSDATNAVIALHGCTLNGKDDSRLQHLARCLSASGSCCIVPTLPGLSRFQWIPSDIDGLTDFILQSPGGAKTVGLLGFSYGGSYALLAAAHPRIAKRIRFVLTFGAYYALDDLFKSQRDFACTIPRRENDLDSWIYMHLVLAKRHAARLPLPDEARNKLTDLLERYCHASTLDEKKTFYLTYLSTAALWDYEPTPPDEFLLQKLSLAGKLNGLKSPVGLFHDADDFLVPAEHAQRIARELAAMGKTHRLLITDLLNHVALSNVFKLRQWYRLATYLLPMVQVFPEEAS